MTEILLAAAIPVAYLVGALGRSIFTGLTQRLANIDALAASLREEAGDQ